MKLTVEISPEVGREGVSHLILGVKKAIRCIPVRISLSRNKEVVETNDLSAIHEEMDWFPDKA